MWWRRASRPWAPKTCTRPSGRSRPSWPRSAPAWRATRCAPGPAPSMTDLLYSAEPIFKVDGTVKGELARDLLRLDVDETTDGLKTLVARVAGSVPHPEMRDVPELYLNGSIVDF